MNIIKFRDWVTGKPCWCILFSFLCGVLFVTQQDADHPTGSQTRLVCVDRAGESSKTTDPFFDTLEDIVFSIFDKWRSHTHILSMWVQRLDAENASGWLFDEWSLGQFCFDDSLHLVAQQVMQMLCVTNHFKRLSVLSLSWWSLCSCMGKGSFWRKGNWLWFGNSWVCRNWLSGLVFSGNFSRRLNSVLQLVVWIGHCCLLLSPVFQSTLTHVRRKRQPHGWCLSASTLLHCVPCRSFWLSQEEHCQVRLLPSQLALDVHTWIEAQSKCFCLCLLVTLSWSEMWELQNKFTTMKLLRNWHLCRNDMSMEFSVQTEQLPRVTPVLAQHDDRVSPWPTDHLRRQ